MDIDKLQPFAGDHAVELAFLAVEWNEPLSTDVLMNLVKLQNKFRNLGLQKHAAVNHVSIKVQAVAGKADINPVDQSVGAYMFYSGESEASPGRNVTITKNSCVITIPDYTRWEQVFGFAESAFKLALEAITTSRPVRSLVIQYNDLFAWKDDPAELDLTRVFKSDHYIPHSVFARTGIWHVHQGFIEDEREPVAYQEIDLLNVELVDVSGERNIRIIGNHRATLADPMWQPHMKNYPSFHEIFVKLHRKNKSILANLLNEEVCAKIKLTPQS